MFDFVDYQAAVARRKDMLEKARKRQRVQELLGTGREQTPSRQPRVAYAARLRQVLAQVIQRPAPAKQTVCCVVHEEIACATC